MAKELTEIPSLPRQTGTLNAFTFDLVHKVILAQGKKRAWIRFPGRNTEVLCPG